MSLSSLLVERMEISRNTPTRDTLGGTTPSWSVVASDVVCRRVTPRGSDDSSIGKRSSFSAVKLNCLPAADILRNDRVTIGGTIYDVIFVGDALGGTPYVHHKQALIEAHS